MVMLGLELLAKTLHFESGRKFWVATKIGWIMNSKLEVVFVYSVAQYGRKHE